jgi:hypothetical protein
MIVVQNEGKKSRLRRGLCSVSEKLDIVLFVEGAI